MDESRIFFAFGTPRSGTTWVQLLLNAHPGITCRSEDQFEFFVRRFGRMLTNYNKLIAELDRRAARQGAFFLDDQDGYALLRTVVLRALHKAGSRTGSPHLGVKDNGILERLALYDQLFPRSRFLLIVRDPRDALVSAWFRNLRMQPDFREQAGTVSRWVLNGSRSWARALAAVRRRGEQMGDRFSLVRYEDLHAEPGATARGVFEFLGADAAPEVVSTCLQATAFDRYSGGRGRGEEVAGDFFRKGEVGDWRNHVDGATAARVRELAGPVMRSFGYE